MSDNTTDLDNKAAHQERCQAIVDDLEPLERYTTDDGSIDLWLVAEALIEARYVKVPPPADTIINHE